MQEGIFEMKKMKIFGLALGVLALVAAAQPAQAACGAPFLITSLGATEYAYLYNPSVELGGGGIQGSSITDQLTGFFWGVGVGDPALGVGADNGSFAALDWLGIYPNYPAYINTTWAASTGIDTCIDVQGGLGERCQVTFMQDVNLNGGGGVFALMSTPDDPASGDFLLTNGSNPINFAPQAAMSILSSTRNGDTGVAMMLSGPNAADIDAGSYLSDAAQCQGTGGAGSAANGLIVGYDAVVQVLPRGSAPPSDFNAAAWTPASQTTPLGTPVSISVPCDGDSDVYASYKLVMDSGFTSPIVSNSTTRIECGPNVADPSQIRVKPEGRQAPRTRSR